MKYIVPDPNKPMRIPRACLVAVVAIGLPVVAGSLWLAYVFGNTGFVAEPDDAFVVPTPTGTRTSPPSTPVIDTDAIVVSGNTVILHWSAIAGASRYGIGYEGYEDPPDDGVIWGYDETESTSHTVEGLTPGVVYTFAIRAYGDGVRYSADWSRSAVVEVRIPPDDDMSEEGGAGSDE